MPGDIRDLSPQSGYSRHLRSPVGVILLASEHLNFSGAKPNVAGKFNRRLEPELRLTIWMADMDVNTALLAREEEKTKFAIAEDRW